MRPPPAFTHLHVHSHYSLLDGASPPAALARRAASLGQEALALTDWGLYGAVVFDRACRDVGVRPIHGAEIALAEGSHLTLLVRDAAGWRSLCRLLTTAQLAASKGHAPVAREMLAANTEGLICLSGCRHGALAAPLLRGDEAGAWRAVRWLLGLFGEHLWIELPRNAHPDDRPLARRLAALADRLGVGAVASANVHYATRDEAPLADTLACLRAGTTLEAARHLRPNDCYHLADDGEMAARYADLPEALANTGVVAAQCRFDLTFGPHQFPSVPLPEGRTPDAELRALCRTKLTERYHGGEPAIWRRAILQLDHELATIAKLGLAPFFLVVHDTVRFAREAGIPNQGRGSAAGSVVSFVLGISKVEPLSNRLLFERFLSEERGSLPDVDIDFGHNRREEVIQHLYATYGARHVAMACTFQTFHMKGAVRDVGKVLGIPPPTLEAIAERVRQGLEDTLAASVIAVVGEAALDSPLWGSFVALCERIIETPRHLGLHNGGMVVTGPPLGEIVPLEHARKAGRVVVQWDKESLELAGLIKLDVLGLQGLDLVDEAVRLVREHEGVNIDLDRLRLDDAATFDLLCDADTIGTFQVESRAQQQFLPLHRPRAFQDLVTQIAIIRPGPLQGGMVHPFLRRRAGEEAVTYAHPLLEGVLEDTMGVILFQEQVLECARVLSDFTLGAGDELRRAMGSKRSPTRMAALEERFMAGAVAKGVPESVAAEVFRQISAFAGYGFPRAHSVAFARLAYETCYVRTHHLEAFVAARLNAMPGGFYPPAVIVSDARHHGVAVLGPDLLASAFDCTLERRDGALAVRLGLRYVRGLSKVRGAALVAERERGGHFHNLRDLCRRCRDILNPKAVEAIIASGACDGWGESRRRLLWAVPNTWHGARGLPLTITPPPLPAATQLEMRAAETWATGLPLGGHLVATQRPALAARHVLPLAALDDTPEGAAVIVAGRLTILQRPPTARGYAFVTLEDESALGNCIFTPAVDQASRAALHAAPLVLVSGRVQRRGQVVNVMATQVEPWWPIDGDEAAG